MNEDELLKAGIGRKLVFLGHAADMISISLSAVEADPYEYAVHIMASGAVFFQGKQLTNTEEINIYGKVRSKSTYEEKTAKLLNSGTEFILQAISYDSDSCLSLVFNHELEIKSIHEKDLEPGDELWRVFFPWKAENSMVCRQAGIELEQPECSQEELNRIRMLCSENT